MKILIAGAGRIGLPLAKCLMDDGDDVTIYETNTYRATSLRYGRIPFYEPGLEGTKFNVITQLPDNNTVGNMFDWIFVCYGPFGSMDVDNFIDSVEPLMGLGNLVLRGANPPDTARAISARYMCDVVCCPERTVEGDAVNEERNLPKIIGDINGTLAGDLKTFFELRGYNTIHASDATVAEVCKLTDNTFRFTKIVFTVELSKVCDTLGIDPNEVVSICNKGYDRNQIMRPGLGAYGLCLQKDPKVFSEYSHPGGMIRGAIGINSYPLDQIAFHVAKCDHVAVLGLAFKGGSKTDDTRLSPFEYLAKMCRKVKFTTYDPVVKGTHPTINAAIEGAQAVVILTPCEEFKDVEVGKGVVVFDPWGMMS